MSMGQRSGMSSDAEDDAVPLDAVEEVGQVATINGRWVFLQLLISCLFSCVTGLRCCCGSATERHVSERQE